MATSTKNKVSWSLGIALFTVLVAGFFVYMRPWQVTPTARPIVRVAYLPIYADLPLFVAAKRGFFEKRGLDVRLERFEASPDMSAAMLSDRVDAIASIATSSALAIESRDPGRFKIFMVDAENPQEYLSSLLVSSTSPIQNITELKGKRIGSFPGPTAKIFAPIALSALGLEKDSYTIEELQIDSHLSALESGRIDAVITYEPTATQGVMKYKSRKLVAALIESNVINPWQAGVWIMNTEFLTKNKFVATQFVLAVYEALEYLRGSPQDAKKMLVEYTRLDSELVLQTPNIPFTKISEVDLVALQKHADLLYEHKNLSKRIDIPQLMMSDVYDARQ